MLINRQQEAVLRVFLFTFLHVERLINIGQVKENILFPWKVELYKYYRTFLETTIFKIIIFFLIDKILKFSTLIFFPRKAFLQLLFLMDKISDFYLLKFSTQINFAPKIQLVLQIT